MSSSTSSSEPKGLGAGPRGHAPFFLAAMAGSAVLTVAAFSFAPESFIHTAPEYGMAQAFEDRITSACRNRITPDLLIVGDSRAVAGVSVKDVRAAGIDAEKFALGGAGIFAGWETLDRLMACGVRPATVVMAYGTLHMLETGALMERTVNYDLVKGERGSHIYSMASEWEHRTPRKMAYKAASILGTEATLLDFVMMRPGLRNVLERPPVALQNNRINQQERSEFFASGGDRYYGQANGTSALPDERDFHDGFIAPMNVDATKAIQALSQEYGFDVLFYTLPVSETAKAGLEPRIFRLSEEFHAGLASMGVVAINDIWTLPDADFGDPSHVNRTGRAKVTADFIARMGKRMAMRASLARPAGLRGRHDLDD